MILKFREQLLGGHVHVDVFVGRDRDHLANAGRLVFGVDEWPTLAAALQNGAPGTVIRAECPGCLHGGHAGEECLAAIQQGETDLVCLCGAAEPGEAQLVEVGDVFRRAAGR